MRMSQLFTQTLRDTPSEAATPGYQFLLRAGFLRPLAPGSYSFLPLGVQTRRKLEALVHQTMRSLGGQEVALPLVQPADLLLEASRRQQGEPVVRFRDRAQRDVVLGARHIEAILSTARNVLQSYRQLPVLLYHIWAPFRDESRSWGGLFGAREPQVLDGYSLHPDRATLDDFYARVQAAFSDVFERCELSVLSLVTGDGDPATSHTLMWPSDPGEEVAIVCPACGYAADQSIARTAKPSPPAEELLPMQDVETPDCKTIADLARFLNIPASRTAKALFLVAYIEGQGDRFVFAVVRGDTNLNEAKLKRALGAEAIGPATEAEIRSMGAEPGYGSPVGLQDVTLVVDDWIPRSPNLVAGANRYGYHTLNVNYGRDYQAALVADITLAQEGDACPECGAPLRAEQGVEMAAMAHLDDSYSRTLNASYLDQNGQAQPLVMGHYRLYLDRLLAAVAETHHDEHGLLWPAAVAPYQVYLMTLGKRSETVEAAAGRLYAGLSAAGVDVLFDDRDERAGVKFNDADLIGLPLRVAVGERGLQSGSVELKRRGAAEVEIVPLEELTRQVLDYLAR